MDTLRLVQFVCAVLLGLAYPQLGVHIQAESPTFLNPKMQKQYEEDSKRAHINVSRAVVSYSQLREILTVLINQGETLRHFDSQSEPELPKQLDFSIPKYYPGFSTFRSAEGQRWEDISDSEPVLQYVDLTHVCAINRSGVEIEEFVPDAHIFINPQMRDLYLELPISRRIQMTSSYRKYSQLRMLLARLKEIDPKLVTDFDSESTKDKLDRVMFSGDGSRRLSTFNSSIGKTWLDLRDGEAVVEIEDSTGKYAVDHRGFEIVEYNVYPCK